MLKMMREERVQIAGAGPAGLVAAITLARAGRSVIVHEIHSQVGYRFGRDLQGLENWTTAGDVLGELAAMDLDIRFDFLPCYEGMAYDAWHRGYPCRSREPLFYMIERGPNPGSLDWALYQQARELGVAVRFNSRVSELNGQGIWATGPRATDALAGGYHFDTDMSDGFWVICDNRLAPGGYAYLLVMNGRGTVKSCMFRKFQNCRKYAKATVEVFTELVGLRMKNPVWHAGSGNFCLPSRAMHGNHPMAGEKAGFQDTLWGFGIRHAMRSGMLAAQALLQESDYEQSWRKNIGHLMKASIVNRLFYSRLGNHGYRRLLQHQARHPDARLFLRDYYQMNPLKRLFLPVAKLLVRSKRKDLRQDLTVAKKSNSQIVEQQRVD
jgi:flavin-dependent dehydrogenase